MSDFLKLISSYNLFNNLLPGVVFCVLASQLFEMDVVKEDLVTGVFFYYFVGVVISRVGSIVIEPLLKHLKVIEFTSYQDYLNAKEKDADISILLEQSNSYRSILGVAFCLLCTYFHFILIGLSDVFNKHHAVIYISLLLIMFALAYRKQTRYIVSRINKVNKA